MFGNTLSQWLAGSACATGLLALSAMAVAAPVPLASPPALTPGYLVEWVQVDQSPNTIAEAKAALSGTGGFNIVEKVSDYQSLINFDDISVPFADSNADKFAIRVSGYIRLSGGDYTFAGRHDDGLLLTIGGEDVIVFDSNTSATTSTSATFSLASGIYAFEAISWEQGGAFELQLGLSNPASASGVSLLEGYHADGATVPEPASLALVGVALMGLGALRLRQRG